MQEAKQQTSCIVITQIEMSDQGGMQTVLETALLNCIINLLSCLVYLIYLPYLSWRVFHGKTQYSPYSTEDIFENVTNTNWNECELMLQMLTVCLLAAFHDI